jgi:hypothetical protein
MTTNWQRVAKAAPSPSVLVFALVIAVVSWFWLPKGGMDWRDDIAPGARAWRAPWAEGLPLIPWAAVALRPLAALPDRLATAVVNGASVVLLGLLTRRLGGKDWYAIPVMLTPLGYWMMGNGQIDCLLLAGLWASRGLDVVILITKPQVAAGAIVARLRQAGTWRQRAIYLAPAVAALLVSLVIWPGWPMQIAGYRTVLLDASWNWAIWPWGLPIAAWLLWRAWQTGKEAWGLLATPFLFPYVNAHTFVVAAAVAAVLWPRAALAAWLVLWAAFGWLTVITYAPPWAAWVYGAAMAVVLVVATARVTPWLRGRRAKAAEAQQEPAVGL